MNYPLCQVSPSSIRIGDRLRSVDRDVTELAESMKARGLIYPITVRHGDDGHLHLVAGRHRLKAARQLHWDAIAAYTFTGSDIEAELVQIDENLIRRELTVIERAEHLARRKELYEVAHPSARHGGDRRQQQDAESAACSFVADTARLTGTSERTVAVDVQIGTDLAPDVIEAVKDSPLADEKTALLELSRLDHAEQRAVVGQMDAARQDVRDKQALTKRIKEEIKARRRQRKGCGAAKPKPAATTPASSMTYRERLTLHVDMVAGRLPADELPDLVALLRELADAIEAKGDIG